MLPDLTQPPALAAQAKRPARGRSKGAGGHLFVNTRPYAKEPATAGATHFGSGTALSRQDERGVRACPQPLTGKRLSGTGRRRVLKLAEQLGCATCLQSLMKALHWSSHCTWDPRLAHFSNQGRACRLRNPSHQPKPANGPPLTPPVDSAELLSEQGHSIGYFPPDELWSQLLRQRLSVSLPTAC